MLQPFSLLTANSYQEDFKNTDSYRRNAIAIDGRTGPEQALHLFDRQQLLQEIAHARASQQQLMLEWRSYQRGTVSQWQRLSLGDVVLSLFCLLLSMWILLIWQSEAPFWWVPGLALFFGIAAFAAIHEAILHNPQIRKAELRREIRRTRSKISRAKNRFEIISPSRNQ